MTLGEVDCDSDFLTPNCLIVSENLFIFSLASGGNSFLSVEVVFLSDLASAVPYSFIEGAGSIPGLTLGLGRSSEIARAWTSPVEETLPSEAVDSVGLAG